MLALGQANAASKAKKAFREAGYQEWSLRHCFFVNMGGLHLQFLDREAVGKCSFPVDCSQLLYLANHKYIQMPKISEGDIDDRNKADDLARLIAVIQSLWFTIDSLGRIAQGLYLTTIELTTLTFVLLMTASSICWWRKPMDVSWPMIVRVNADLCSILQEANAPTTPRGLTPLSYLSRREWFLSRFWAYYTQILRNMELIPIQKPEPTEGDHVPSIDFPEVDFKWEVIASSLIIIYSCIFLAAWNFEFPTNNENFLWRIAALINLSYAVVGTVVAGPYHHPPRIRCRLKTITKWISRPFRLRKSVKEEVQIILGQHSSSGERKGAHWLLNGPLTHYFDWIRNTSPDKDPAMQISLRWLTVITTLCAMYCLSRAFILIEDIIALRSLPASAYQTVNYGVYSPIL